MKKTLTILTLSTVTCFAVQAEVRINGFANLIGGITTSSDDTLYSYNDKISFSEESLFAIQVSGDINDKMTATGQIVARAENDYDAKFEWAYVTYKATDNLSVSAGRLRLPFFRYSASLDVGYSYHWVAPPTPVYDVNFNNIDGLRFDYSNYSGDWEYNVQVAVGKITAGTDLKADNAILMSLEATYDWFKIRGIVGTSKATLDSTGTPALQGALDLLDSLEATDLANDLRLENDSAPFLGLGIEMDKFDWFVSGEITSLEVDNSFTEKDIAYYVTAGLRLGKYTPSLTYDKKDSDQEFKFQDRIAAAPEALRPTLTAVSNGLQASNFKEFTTLTLGLRYDMDTNIALKADLSKYSDDLDDTGDATLVRFAVNYVF